MKLYLECPKSILVTISTILRVIANDYEPGEIIIMANIRSICHYCNSKKRHENLG